ncbi:MULTISPECIES: enolase C-terminal domain-like protein [Anaeromyxobacter]|uniref:enolase C-terminal domain-like protein n=1 Tax=Anaeromyxobacter TaxID=161492 RepID=UPI001F55F7AF|nr:MULTISPECIES: enolase C-terminal domain-like protein [unclassified Anaeromyxobacter]
MPAPSVPELPPLTIRGVTTFAVEVPMTYPLGTSAATVTRAPLLLVELETDEGITGRTYLFCYRRSVPRAIDAVLRDAVSVVEGDPAAPLEIASKLARRFALVGVASVVRMALSALDAAIWDALAVAAGAPLATLLGARPRPIPAYNSSGLGLMSPDAAADEAEKLLAGGFRSVKLRLGHPTLEEDLAVTRAVRGRLPDEIALPVDYNQALSVSEAIRRGRALESEGIAWLEEPTRHDDYAGNAAIARALSVPVQLGENFNGPESMIEALGAGACDHVMPDAARIGGVTGWIQAAGIAAAHRIEMSSHLLPELSAHLLAATPTCHYLEYVDWADAILEEPLQIADGLARIPERPGIGLRFRPEAVEALSLGR